MRREGGEASFLSVFRFLDCLCLGLISLGVARGSEGTGKCFSLRCGGGGNICVPQEGEVDLLDNQSFLFLSNRILLI